MERIVEAAFGLSIIALLTFGFTLVSGKTQVTVGVDSLFFLAATHFIWGLYTLPLKRKEHN